MIRVPASSPLRELHFKEGFRVTLPLRCRSAHKQAQAQGTSNPAYQTRKERNSLEKKTKVIFQIEFKMFVTEANCEEY